MLGIQPSCSQTKIYRLYRKNDYFSYIIYTYLFRCNIFWVHLWTVLYPELCYMFHVIKRLPCIMSSVTVRNFLFFTIFVCINPFLPSGLFYVNYFDQFISNIRSVWLVFIFTMFYSNSCPIKKQTVSDHGLHFMRC